MEDSSTVEVTGKACCPATAVADNTNAVKALANLMACFIAPQKVVWKTTGRRLVIEDYGIVYSNS
jgi:hypothetical protein